MANIRRMTKKRLGELLLQEGLINKEHLQTGLEEQEQTGELIGDILVRKGFVTESDVARTISTQFSFPYISVLHYYIAPEMLTLFDLRALERNLFVPIDRFGDVLSVVIAGLLDQDVIDEIERRSECTAQVYVGMVSEVKQVIKEKFARAHVGKHAEAEATPDETQEAMADVTAPPQFSKKRVEKEGSETLDLSEAIMAAGDSMEDIVAEMENTDLSENLAPQQGEQEDTEAAEDAEDTQPEPEDSQEPEATEDVNPEHQKQENAEVLKKAEQDFKQFRYFDNDDQKE
ncbi:MAG: hypothetical protein J7M19_09490 [Planctomycetes bacterium]|nr:hypothetical protein [Planctomycetota bacterium]